MPVVPKLTARIVEVDPLLCRFCGAGTAPCSSSPNHLGLTKDPMFTDNVLHWLLEDPRESPRRAAR